jgi:hypothetical protein
MHLHSLLWLAALTMLVGWLYRSVLGLTWAAGLATILFAVDDAHALPAGWICNRNTLIAATFGVSCLLAHVHWAQHRKLRWYLLALGLWTASLCSKEAGIATIAYVFAWVVWMQRDSLWAKFISLVPYGAILIVWRIARDQLGYGVQHVGLYIDPVTDPSRFLAATVQRAPALLMGQWALPPAGVWAVLPESYVTRLWWGAVVLIAALSVLFWPLLRTDRAARFFATGMLLAIVPICAAFPMDRLLMFVGIGAFGLLARFVQFAFARSPAEQFSSPYTATAKWGAVCLLVIHLAIAPVALTYRAANPFGPPKSTSSLYLRTALPDEAQEQDLIVVNPPSPLHLGYFLVMGELEHRVLPRRLRCLATGVTSITIRREDERTLVIQPRAGFMPFMLDQLVRSEQRPMTVGQIVQLTGITVEVLQTTADHRPAAARFEFDVPLEDSSLRWMCWREGQFEGFTPPPVGGEMTLTPPALRRLLTGNYRP